MNDTELNAFLDTIHTDLRRPPAPSALHERVLAVPYLVPRQRRPRPLPHRFGSMFSAARFAVAAVVVALFGGFVFVAQPVDQRGATAPGAATTSLEISTPMPLPAPYGSMEPGTYRVELGDDWPAVTFTIGEGWTGSNDRHSPPGISKRGVGSISFGITTEVDMGVHDDPAIACGAPYTLGPIAEATVGNVVAAWRSNHEDPTPPPVDFLVVGGLPVMSLTDEYDIVKDNLLGCGGAPPWEPDRSAGVLDWRSYLVGLDGAVLEIWFANWADASPAVVDELEAILDSLSFEVDGTRINDLPAGELAIEGRYFMFPDSGGFQFEVPATGWFASLDDGGWVLTRHVLPSSPDSDPLASWRISLLGPDVVYSDPCAQTEGPPVGDPADFAAPRGANAAELVAALETVEGISVLSSSTDPYWPKTVLGLDVPEDIGCKPEDYALWSSEGQAARHPSAVPTRFRVWVLDLSSDRHIAGIHGSDRVFVEAELLPGAGPEIEQELQGIVDTISFPG